METPGLFPKKERSPRLWPWLFWILFGIMGFLPLTRRYPPFLLTLLPLWFYGLLYIMFACRRYTLADKQTRSEGIELQLSVDKSWFQIHFSTAIVLMLAASAILGVLILAATTSKQVSAGEVLLSVIKSWDVILGVVGFILDMLIPLGFGMEQFHRTSAAASALDDDKW